MLSSQHVAALSRLERQISSLATRLDAEEAVKAAAERSRLLATRPDIPAELARSLASAPLATVRAVVAVPPGSFGTLGGREAQKASIAAKMGRVSLAPQRVRLEGRQQIFPVMTPEQARAQAARGAR